MGSEGQGQGGVTTAVQQPNLSATSSAPVGGGDGGGGQLHDLDLLCSHR